MALEAAGDPAAVAENFGVMELLLVLPHHLVQSGAQYDIGPASGASGLTGPPPARVV
jgi:hypothetical protein